MTLDRRIFDRTIQSSRIIPRSIEFLSRRADFTFIEIPRPRIVCRELQQFSRGEGRDGEILKNLHQADITFHQTLRKKKKPRLEIPFHPSPSLFIKAIRRSSTARGRHARHKKAARLSARGHAPFNPRPCVGEEPWGCTAVEINRGWPELSSNLISARHRWPTTESCAASVRWREG